MVATEGAASWALVVGFPPRAGEVRQALPPSQREAKALMKKGDDEVPDFQQDVARLQEASEGGNTTAREEFLTESLDTENVAVAMLNRAVNGTPAKRLISSIVKATTSEALRQSSSSLTLRTALAQAQRDKLRTDTSAEDPSTYQGLGLAAKVQLLEVREKVHRSLVVKAKLLQQSGTSLAGGLSDSLSSEDYKEAASVWMGVTSEWIGVDSKEDQTSHKVRSNRFLADLAAIRQGRAPGDSVWQALQRERSRQRAAAHRLKQQKESTARLKPRPFATAEDGGLLL